MEEKQNLCEARHFILAFPRALEGRYLWKKESNQVCPLLLCVSNHPLPLVFAKVLLPAVLDSAYLPLYSWLENPMNSTKRQKDKTLNDELPRSVGAQYATGIKWRKQLQEE